MRPEPYSPSVAGLLETVGRERIRVTAVETTPLTWAPPDGSLVLEAGPIVQDHVDLVVLRVFTDAGIVGVGPGSMGSQESYQRLLGHNVFDAVASGLPGGLDVACWDIIGKAKGLPVYRLLATDHVPKPEVHVYASGGVMWTFYDRGDGAPYGVDALIAEALKYQAMGFDTFKWRPGTDWEEAGVTATALGEEVCRPLRQAVGPDLRLGLEKKAWDTWTLEQCLEIAPILDDLGFLFFEQPMGDVGPGQFADYMRVKERMPHVMLWGGEGLGGLDPARPFIEQRIYDAVQTDCIRVGMTENWRIAQVAQAFGIKMVPHNWTSALGTMCNTHLVAGVPNGAQGEYFMYENNPFRDGLFEEPHIVEKGLVTLTDKPGFGVTLIDIDELQKRYPYRPSASLVAPNPRYPQAWERAKARERANWERYSEGATGG